MVRLLREVFDHADPLYGCVDVPQRPVELDLRGDEHRFSTLIPSARGHRRRPRSSALATKRGRHARHVERSCRHDFIL